MRRALMLFVAIGSFGMAAHPAAKRLARRALRLVALAGLRLRSRPLDLGLGPLAVISPHPDDDVLGCGGLLLSRSRAGLSSSVVYLTDGSASHPGHPSLDPVALAALRRAEATRAGALLGLAPDDLSFLELPDGRLPHLEPAARDAALARLADYFRRLAPSTVLLPLRSDGSSEHAAAHALALEALHLAKLAPSARLLEFPVWALWQVTPLFPLWRTAKGIRRFVFPGDGSVKSHAMHAHASQFSPVSPWTRPVLPEDFSAGFSREEEFFLEMNSAA